MRELLAQRTFVGYWAGVVFSEIGTRATLAANLYLVYRLTGSLATTGLVGLVQGLAVVILGPVAGVVADRRDRRHLLQAAQGGALICAAALAWLTLSGRVTAGAVVGLACLTAVASTFDTPTRNALVANLVPRDRLAAAVALLNPSREIAVLVGPGLAGLLIAWGGAGFVYTFDACTYAAMIVVLALLRRLVTEQVKATAPLPKAILDAVRFVAGRPLIWLLMSLDLTAMVFGAYRVLLPALATDVLAVGPAGYGLLAAAPSAGALIVAYGVVRVVSRGRRLGLVLLTATLSYGLVDIVLAQSRWFGLTVAAAVGLGMADAMATAIRHAAVQLVTPDELRGRVNALYLMTAKGGPPLGDALIGGVASLVGLTVALTAGGCVTIAYALGLLLRPNVVREYAAA